MTATPGRLEPRAARILVCDELSPSAYEVFRERGFEPTVRTGLGEDELVLAARDAHALVVRSATKVTRRVIEAATELRVVGRAGVGVDNVDCDAATERGVVVMNTPTGNTTTTAELALALLCSLARHVARADRAVRAGSWSKKGLTGTELTGKTLGVVGLGRIGRVVADRALGLRMQVLAHDPFLLDAGDEPPVAGVEMCALDELLARSDFVSLHVPLSDQTRGLLSRERLALMKPGARLVNAARGGLVDEAALADALEAGHLAGAALDVLEQEPPPPDHPLLGRDDVLLTPHLGASSAEAQDAVAREVARQIADFLVDGVAHNAVNLPAVPRETLQRVAPWVLLAEKLGSFLAQLAEKPVRKLELTLSGEVARSDHRHVPLAVLCGVLRQSIEDGVNYVNAPLLARERGLRLFESEADEHPSFHGLVKVRATSKGGEETHVAAGTVFGRKPRLVRLDDLHVDVDPSGPILVTRHADRPGVLGLLGTALGRHGVNLRRVELGPPREGAGDGLASAFLSLYDEPPAAALAELRALEPVRALRLVRL